MDEQVLLSLVAGSLTLLAVAIYRYFNRKASYFPLLTLYKYPHFRSNRCLWLISELGIADKVSVVEINVMEKASEEMKAYMFHVHPHGTVPALVVGEAGCVLESGAICLYLADLCGRLVPQDRREYYNTVDEVLEILFTQWNFVSPEKQDKDTIKKAEQKFKIFAHYLDDTIATRTYICGKEFTAADCVLGYTLWWAYAMKDGFLLKDYENIAYYFQRLKSRLSYKAVFDA